MVRTIDYESRKKAVLSATINKYIKSALPIASEDIAADFGLSSATIRNIFAELEEEGFLTHPYTSGGRLPTHRGWRYYVDFLLAQMGLMEDEKENISKEYKKEINRVEDILEKTSEVICDATHHTSIVSFPDLQEKIFYRGISFILGEPEFHDLHRLKLVIKMLEERRRLLDIIRRDFKEKVKVYIGEELGCNEMESCALAISSYSVKNKPPGRLAVLGPIRMEYRQIIPTLEYVSDLLSDALGRF